MDDSAFLSGLVDVQVMDEDLTTCKCVSSRKHVVGTEARVCWMIAKEIGLNAVTWLIVGPRGVKLK